MLFCIILTNLIPTFHILHLPISILLQVCGSMPYDDSNIRRMIRDQTERRVGFSHSRHVTEAARNLIHSILESDVSKRFVNKPLNYYTTILQKQNVEVKACVHCPVSHVASYTDTPRLPVPNWTRGHFWSWQSGQCRWFCTLSFPLFLSECFSGCRYAPILIINIRLVLEEGFNPGLPLFERRLNR